MKTYGVCRSCGAVNRIDAEKSLKNTPHCGHCKAELTLKNGVNELNLKQLNQLIKSSDIPVIVDLWAPWCGPCVSFAPTFQKVAIESIGRYVFTKVDTEKFPDASSSLGVRGIPTIVAFKNGKEVKRQSGAMPEQMFKQWLIGI